MPGFDEAFARVGEDGFDLLFRHGGKSFEKLADSRAVLQVFAERLHRHARVAKQPRAADLAGHTFHRRTLTPIKHGGSLRQRGVMASRQPESATAHSSAPPSA